MTRSLTRRTFRVIPSTGVALLTATWRDQRFAPHAHDYGVFAVTESGEAVVRSGDREAFLRPGHVLAIPPGVIHSAQSLGGAPWRYRALYVAREHFPSPSAAGSPLAGSSVAGSPVAASSVAGSSVVGWPFDKSSVAKFRPAGSPLAQRSVVGALPAGATISVVHAPRVARRLLDLHRALAPLAQGVRMRNDLAGMLRELAPAAAAAFVGSVRNEGCHSAVSDALALIHGEPMRRWTLPVLAQAVGVSRFQLCRAFRRDVGTSPCSYALNRRVAAAHEWLASAHPIGRIACELGFADQSHFTRRFLHVYGLTPGEYRAALRAA